MNFSLKIAKAWWNDYLLLINSSLLTILPMNTFNDIFFTFLSSNIFFLKGLKEISEENGWRIFYEVRGKG